MKTREFAARLAIGLTADDLRFLATTAAELNRKLKQAGRPGARFQLSVQLPVEEAKRLAALLSRVAAGGPDEDEA